VHVEADECHVLCASNGPQHHHVIRQRINRACFQARHEQVHACGKTTNNQRVSAKTQNKTGHLRLRHRNQRAHMSRFTAFSSAVIGLYSSTPFAIHIALLRRGDSTQSGFKHARKNTLSAAPSTQTVKRHINILTATESLTCFHHVADQLHQGCRTQHIRNQSTRRNFIGPLYNRLVAAFHNHQGGDKPFTQIQTQTHTVTHKIGQQRAQ
jgi:hypothetical protein